MLLFRYHYGRTPVYVGSRTHEVTAGFMNLNFGGAIDTSPIIVTHNARVCDTDVNGFVPARNFKFSKCQ
jgi:hypothetical protein